MLPDALHAQPPRNYSTPLRFVCSDLLICDEAHRLKNDATATTMALAQLPCRRRVLLSGTPMQNDLGEFYAMVCRKLATALSGSATVPQTALLILSVGELHQPRCAR